MKWTRMQNDAEAGCLTPPFFIYPFLSPLPFGRECHAGGGKGGAIIVQNSAAPPARWLQDRAAKVCPLVLRQAASCRSRGAARARQPKTLFQLKGSARSTAEGDGGRGQGYDADRPRLVEGGDRKDETRAGIALLFATDHRLQVSPIDFAALDRHTYLSSPSATVVSKASASPRTILKSGRVSHSSAIASSRF